LANDLGAAPVTLCRHVRSRDDLLDAVADELVARQWRPSLDKDDWRRWAMETAANFRDILVSHPAEMQVFLRHPVDSPAALDCLNEMLSCLTAAGFTAREQIVSGLGYLLDVIAREFSAAG
jgi:AcrR family transcriptional regulator